MIEDISKYKDLIVELYKLQANTFVLYLKSWGAHWNVEGINFIELHELFKEVYEGLEEEIDRIAEGIGSLGYKAPANLELYIKLSQLKEFKGNESYDILLSSLLSDLLEIESLLLNCNKEAVKVECEAILNMLQDIIEQNRVYIYKLRRTVKC